MFRAKVLIFMVPLVLPIGQPPARATDGLPGVVECASALDEVAPVILQTAPADARPPAATSAYEVSGGDRPSITDTE